MTAGGLCSVIWNPPGNTRICHSVLLATEERGCALTGLPSPTALTMMNEAAFAKSSGNLPRARSFCKMSNYTQGGRKKLAESNYQSGRVCAMVSAVDCVRPVIPRLVPLKQVIQYVLMKKIIKALINASDCKLKLSNRYM